MRVAILNISIGRYTVFWDGFYVSCEKNFLTDAEKEYFVFSDAEDLLHGDEDNVHLIYQENMGWPFNTMKRYHLFSGIEEKLNRFDYIFFVNGNAIFAEPLTTKLINPYKDLITVQHPANYRIPIDKMPYERNPQSNAYIPYGEGRFYVQGAFVGGKTQPFLDMCRELDKMTEEDIKRGIIAIWHDESFLNMYVTRYDNFQILGRQYLYYEEYAFPYRPVIMLRDKNKGGSVNKVRGIREKKIPVGRMLVKLRNMKERLLIKVGIRRWVEYMGSDGRYIDNDINI